MARMIRVQPTIDVGQWLGNLLAMLRGLLPLAVLVVAALVILPGLFYSVPPDGCAVVKRFGRLIAIQQPGLHFKLPLGIDRTYFVPTERVLKEEFGFRTVNPGRRSVYEKTPQLEEESSMLTGDLNVIDVEWVVQYRITDADKFLHRARDPEDTIRNLSEAVMRRIVGNRLGSDVLTLGRVAVAEEARAELQRKLEEYDFGVRVITVELQDVTPPDPVKPAFNEVNEARQQKERLLTEAEKLRNQVIPRAQGEASRVLAEAEAYESERVNRAKGEAGRFTAILAEYRQARETTRQRLFLETIEQVLPQVERVVVVDPATGGVLPLLNLDETLSVPSPSVEVKK